MAGSGRNICVLNLYQITKECFIDFIGHKSALNVAQLCKLNEQIFCTSSIKFYFYFCILVITLCTNYCTISETIVMYAHTYLICTI